MGLVVPTGVAALADPVYPSQDQVDQARQAAGSAAQQVAALDAAFAAASARLESAQEKAAAAAEEYNGAKLLLARKVAEATTAARQAAAAASTAEDAARKVRQYAAAVYQQNGSLGDLGAFMSSDGPQELVDRLSAMETVGEARNRTLKQASSTSQVAVSLQARAAQARGQQQAAADRAEKSRRAAEQQQAAAAAMATQVKQAQQSMVVQLAHLQKTSVKLEQDRQVGLRAEAERRARAAAAVRARAAAAEAARRSAADRERARQDRARADRDNRPSSPKPANEPSSPKPPTPPSTPTVPVPPPPPPPPSGGVSAVLAYARAQLGKPYLWGGSGPNSFDCSGLTLMAWRRAGVYLSHYTGAQWAETARVPISDLRPGDLVFYGTSGPTSHHMGLYVGGGQMIEAPHSGAVVRYASIYRSDLLPYGGRPS